MSDRGEESRTEYNQVLREASSRNEELQRFGMRVFDARVSTFAPTDDAPILDSYRLGVGDQLVVQLFGKENDQLYLEIARTGDVSFPKLGSITVAGLSFEDASSLLKLGLPNNLSGNGSSGWVGCVR